VLAGLFWPIGSDGSLGRAMGGSSRRLGAINGEAAKCCELALVRVRPELQMGAKPQNPMRDRGLAAWLVGRFVGTLRVALALSGVPCRNYLAGVSASRLFARFR